MKSKNNMIWLAAVAGVLVLLAFAACSTSQPLQQIQTPKAVLPLEDCEISSPGSSEAVDARCGRLKVKEDPDTAGGREIELFVAVIPAVSRIPQGDPLFLLAGGPGEAAAETFPMFMSVFDKIHQKRDIVLFDQRGTGQSNPLKCPSTAENIEPTSDDFDLAKVKKEMAACLSGFDADPRLYTTTQAVSDLEQVRSALGYEKMNLLGVSYGSRVALAYLREYPDRVATATLDGVNPIDWELGPHNPANAQRAVDLILDRCEKDPACSEAFPEVRAEFDEVITSLEEQPAEVTLPHPISGEMETVSLTHQRVATTILLNTYSPENSAMLPLMIHAARQGDYRGLAAHYLSSMDSLEKSIADGLYLSVLCSEDMPFYPQENPTADSYLPVRLDLLKQQCQLWPHEPAPDEFKEPVGSNVPVLILSGQADPITPPSNGDQAAATLTNSLHLVTPEMGHGQFYRGCIPRVITSFIQQGSLENLDASCISEIKAPPFFVTLAGPQP